MSDFKKYTGERDKRHYDIRLKTGKVLNACYPNAYSWFDWESGDRYEDREVDAIRECVSPFESLENKEVGSE